MAAAVDIISKIFAAVSIGALLFFSHKVVWLVRYKKLQQQLIAEAQEKLFRTQGQTLPSWDEFAAAAWRVARGPARAGRVKGPIAYVEAVEHELASVLEACDKRRVSLVRLLQNALADGESGARTVLELPDRSSKRPLVAAIQLAPSPVASPAALEPELFELDVKSRYGFFRRALVFFAGVADVVYSSSHIAKMSQHSHVSLGTILRRMSLVLLLVIGIVLEVALGMRKHLEAFLDERVVRGAAWVKQLPSEVQPNVAAILALVGWTLAIAAIYFLTYMVIRRKHRANLAALERLRTQQSEQLQAIRDTHFAQLVEWAGDYGRTLDVAVELTTRHIAVLGEHFAQRVLRRMAGAPLLQQAERMGDALFLQLPESSSKLQTTVSTTKPSFRHALWPRAEEMGAAVAQAQYREAWQHIQLTLNDLRVSSPNPEQVAAFWRELVAFAASFDNVFDDKEFERLRAAYVTVIEQASDETERDLQAFRHAIAELIEHLNEQLAAATPLLEARIELCNQRIEADAAKLEAKVIRTRERARLEAMAFEI